MGERRPDGTLVGVEFEQLALVVHEQMDCFLKASLDVLYFHAATLLHQYLP